MRVAIVVEDATARASLMDALRASPVVDVVAWAESVQQLLVLGTRADVCLCTSGPSAYDAARLARRGCAVALGDGDPLAAVLVAAGAPRTPTPAVRRPQLSPRQNDVLLAYVSGSDLLPTVARRLGMDPETVKTHLRRIRTKYGEAGRPAPTRRDLYARALEDGLLAPPSGRS